MLIAFFFNLTEILLLFSMSSLLRTCIGLALSYLNVLSSSLLSSLCTSVLILLQAVSPSSGPGREPGEWGRGAVSGVHRVGPIQLFEVLLQEPQAWSLLKWAKPCVQMGLPASTCHPASLHPPMRMLVPCRPWGSSGLSHLLVFWSLWRHSGI